MTAKAALCKALLDGRVLNVKNVFQTIGLTNCAREISRMVEKPFGVEVSRTHREGKSRYGQSVVWVDYRLNRTEYNLNGIEKMKEYVANKIHINPTTDKQVKQLKEASIPVGEIQNWWDGYQAGQFDHPIAKSFTQSKMFE